MKPLAPNEENGLLNILEEPKEDDKTRHIRDTVEGIIMNSRPRTKKELVSIVQKFIGDIKRDILIFDFDSVKDKIKELEWFLEEER